MKITNAIWEKRNLGVDTVEVEINEHDSEEEICEALSSINSIPYSVVKISSECSMASSIVQDYGYKFIECSFQVEGSVSEITKPEMYKRFDNSIYNKVADKKMIDYVRECVEKKLIFDTDRISNDPFFSKEIAGYRYSNWIKDEADKGSIMFVSYYKNIPVAFTDVKRVGESDYISFLGGVLAEEYKKLGFIGMYLLVDEIKNRGGKKIVTTLSTNNMPIIRLHMLMGYRIQNCQYVYIRHVK